MNTNRNRIIGCLVGGAIGDAVGGIGERKRLSLSDDTQLTLATCEAISESSLVSPPAIAATFAKWFKAGAVTGLGSSTLKALRDLSSGAHWALAGARGEMAAGNGAAMRIAPLAFVLDPLSEEHRVTIRDICRITHHSDEAYIGALAILLALNSVSPEDPGAFFNGIAETLPDSRVRDRLHSYAILPEDEPLVSVARQFGVSGYVVETVPFSLLLSTRITPDTFEKYLYQLNEIGGDTDTIGSIAGQLIGARYGIENLPSNLIDLPEVQHVPKLAEAFCRTVLLAQSQF